MPRKGPNKTKAWRKIKRDINPNTGLIERYGRRFKHAMREFDKSTGVHPIVFWLMKSAGVSTPILDMKLNTQYNKETLEEQLNATV